MAGIVSQRIDKADPFKDVQGYEASQVSMGDGDSVESRLERYISRDNEVSQLARTRARQQQNASGRLNTSMTDTAVTKGIIESALPIVSQDASTAATYKLANQNAEDQANQFTATQGNAARMQAEKGNQAIEQIQESGSQNRLSQDNQGIIASKLQSEGYEQDLGRYSAQGEQDRETIGVQTDSESRLLSESSQLRMDEMYAGFGYDRMLQELRGDQAKELTEIETANQMLMQSSQSAAIVFAQHAEAIGNILANPEIPANQKQGLINKQIELLQNAMHIQGAISDTNLGDLLTWDTSDSSLSNLPGSGTGFGYKDVEGDANANSPGNNNQGGNQPPRNTQASKFTAEAPDGSNISIPVGFNWAVFLDDQPDLKAAQEQSGLDPAVWGQQWVNGELVSGGEFDQRIKDQFGQPSQSGDDGSNNDSGGSGSGSDVSGYGVFEDVVNDFEQGTVDLATGTRNVKRVAEQNNLSDAEVADMLGLTEQEVKDLFEQYG